MRIEVAFGYKNSQTQWEIIEVTEDMLPLDVCPSMCCDLLIKLPQDNEKVYLGLSGAHMYPGDVIVTKVDDNTPIGFIEND